MRRWLPLADPLALPLLPAMPVSEVGMINLFKGIRVDQQELHTCYASNGHSDKPLVTRLSGHLDLFGFKCKR